MRESSWENQKKRKLDFIKAVRKQKLSKELYHMEYYDNLHQYADNKIHCSCELCRFRPAWNPDAKPLSDMRRIDSMQYQLKEYYSGA